MNLTPWFQPEVKPVHVGWYLTDLPEASGYYKKLIESDFNWWWDGEFWKTGPHGWKVRQDRHWKGRVEK